MSLKNIKLIVTDLDGTVLEHGKLANDLDVEVFKQANQKGVYTTIATGQPYISAKSKADLFNVADHVDLFVLSNGSLISKVSEFDPIYINSIPSDIVNKVVKKLTDLNVCAVIFTATINDVYWNNISFTVESMNKRNWFERFNKTICSTNTDFDFKNVVQIMSFVEQEKEQELQSWFVQENMNQYLTFMKSDIESMPVYEFTNITATKGNAIEKMAEILNIKKDEIAIFGDNINDISMFEKIPNCVAVGNAVDEIKHKAKYITDTNLNGGVGKFIKKYILED
ncbi:Cof-type HAD-IIB family hydrolase [Mycoplasma cottewii]|uniref:Cof-type HAD-IIB family hydrolase n=1 Tax=Mycoplasma cottewii TaxID=51364 RepID=A0ABY5TWX9_9MOLU|nr:HAD family hydrolase [Mycoplasma cottewii]UWD35179.1 Cof-type HAD-IIB family hydrolase [Mycoplasma cottewii]